MKLIQLNIWGGKLVNEILDFVNEEKPDILCMQEVHDIRGLTNYLFAPLGEIKEVCNFSYSAMSPVYELNYMNRKAHYGNAILSQQKILSSKIIFTRGSFTENFDCTTDDNDYRNFQHIQIQEAGLHLINYHGTLGAPGSKMGNDETFAQMKTIDNYIKTLLGPIIFTGDLNLTPNSSSVQLLNKILRNLSLEYNLDNTYSQFGRHKEVCDYIFVNEKIKVKNFTASEALVSDHKPLILEFAI